MQCLGRLLTVGILMLASVSASSAQTNWNVWSYFQQLGLTQGQISSLRNGQPVALSLPSRSPAEIIVFGAIYINALPESYVDFAGDFGRLSKEPGFLAIREFSSPPQLSDLQGFGLDSEDIQALKSCKPGDCQIQLPGNVMDELHSTINWSGSDVDRQVNQFLQRQTLRRLQEYQRQGDNILGAVYNDKRQPTTRAEQFKYILSYNKVYPQSVPGFYQYLLSYPGSTPSNISNSFYWDSVKFGLKPTLRVVHVVTMKGVNASEPAYVIAEKQLYASHYFETALDLTFCFSSSGDPTKPGFYLVQILGSEQAGLSGLKGSMVRRIAVGKTVSSLQQSLVQTKTTLEHK